MGAVSYRRMAVGLALVAGCSTSPPKPGVEPVASVHPRPVMAAPSVASADLGSTDGGADGASAAVAPPVPVPPLDLPLAKPCAVEISGRDSGASDVCIPLERVQPEGRPLDVCLSRTARLVFRFDASGRIVGSPGATYTYGPGRDGVRVSRGQTTKLTFDASGRIVKEGTESLRYDARGRLVRREGAKRFLAYIYAPDDTYTTSHNYPDRDEFCVADRVEVRRDPRGRVELDRYDHCGINEVPRTLHYRYGPSDVLDTIDVDVESDGTIDGTVKLRYACP